MLKTICAATVLALALTGAAGAAENNSASAAANAAARNATDLHKPGHWRGSKLSGVNVYNNNGDKVGDISDIILDQTGKVAGVVLGVGGFLGMGEHYVAVNYDQLKWSNEPVRSGNTASNENRTRETTTGANTDNRQTSNNRNDWYPDHAVLNATKDQLKAMPEFKW
jgi:hypothetical protein